MSIADSRSVNMSKTQQDVLTCLKCAEDGGLFSTSSASDPMTMDSNNADDGLEQVCEEQVAMEDIWKAEYEQHRLQWKKNTCEPLCYINLRPTEDVCSNSSSSILHDGSVFRVSSSTEQDIETHEPSICQYTEI